MTTPLQATRYDRLVRRVMNLVGEGAIVTGVLPDVFPIIDLENIPQELMALESWYLAFGGENFLSTGGNFPNSQVSNPAGSGNIVVVENALVTTTATTGVHWRTSTTAMPTLVAQMQFRDTRFTTQSPTQVRRENAAVPIPRVGIFTKAANDPQLIFPPGVEIILFPGNTLDIGNQVANTRLEVTYYTRERQLEQSELIE